MRTLIIVFTAILATQIGIIDKVETTPTGTLVTYQDGTGYYIGE